MVAGDFGNHAQSYPELSEKKAPPEKTIRNYPETAAVTYRNQRAQEQQNICDHLRKTDRRTNRRVAISVFTILIRFSIFVFCSFMLFHLSIISMIVIS